MTAAVSPHEQAVRAKLVRVLGAEIGVSTLQRLMNDLSMASIISADDVLRVAARLDADGGMMAVIASSLVIHAQLHGARSR